MYSHTIIIYWSIPPKNLLDIIRRLYHPRRKISPKEVNIILGGYNHPRRIISPEEDNITQEEYYMIQEG